MNYTSISLRSLMKWEHLVLGTDIVPKQRVSSLLAGKHSSMMRGRGLDFEEVRNYVPGDDIRNIDWKVTARTKKTHSKVFNEEKERPALVMVDQSSYMHFGSEQYLKSVIAAEASAMAAFRTIKKGDRCGGIVIHDDGMEWFAPKRSRQAVLQLLKSVSSKNQTLHLNKTSKNQGQQFNTALKRIANYVTHDFVITIVSDFSQCDEISFETIKKLAQHNDVICVHIEDELDLITQHRSIVITDGVKQVFWKKQNSSVIESEKEKEQNLRETLINLKRKHFIPILYLNTKDSLEKQIRNTFKTRK